MSAITWRRFRLCVVNPAHHPVGCWNSQELRSESRGPGSGARIVRQIVRRIMGWTLTPSNP